MTGLIKGYIPLAYRQITVGKSDDYYRIKALPKRAKPFGKQVQALITMMTNRFRRPISNIKCHCYKYNRDCITQLNLPQSWALYEIGLTKGLLGNIQVGAGKTILGLLAPLALQVQKSILLVPPTLMNQLVDEYNLLSQHFVVPSLIFWSDFDNPKSYTKYGSYTIDSNPSLHVLAYSRLSSARATAFLEKQKYEAIIADEVHFLRNATATRTARVLRFMTDHPETKFCGWSGSITDKSIKDYGHLAAFALKSKSPLPINARNLDVWAMAIDPIDMPAKPGILIQLFDIKQGESIQQAYHRHLAQTQGFVTTNEVLLDAKLDIRERTAPSIPPIIQDALDKLRRTWTRPDGEELVEALEVSRVAIELACGFYYRWIFPHREPKSLISEWFEVRKAWHKELREKLKLYEPFLDSPLLCTQAAMRYRKDLPANPDLPSWASSMWSAWRDIRDKVKPETEAVRLHSYLALDAVRWAQQHRGIVWYQSRDFGQWMHELSDLPLHGGGPDAGLNIKKETGKTSILVSIKSHGTGRDGLQFLFDKQLVAQPPSSATPYEQLLGRLYRIGQKSKTVTCEFYCHTEELHKARQQALKRAEYVAETMGSPQKMLDVLND